jgi:hypothetical protein
MSNAISEKSHHDPIEEFMAWAKAFKEKLKSPPSYEPLVDPSSKALPLNVMHVGQLEIKKTWVDESKEMLRQMKELLAW